VPQSNDSRRSSSHNPESDQAAAAKKMEPLPADHSYKPKALGSWARRTGYKSHRSGGGGGDSMSEIEIGITAGADQGSNRSSSVVVGGGPAAPQHPKAAAPSSSPEVLTNSAARNQGLKSKAVAGPAPAPGPNLLGRTTLVVPGKKAGSESENVSGAQSNCPPNSGPFRIDPLRIYKDSEAADGMSQPHEDAADNYSLAKHSHMKYEIRETPGLCKQAIKLRCLLLLLLCPSLASVPLFRLFLSFALSSCSVHIQFPHRACNNVAAEPTSCNFP
jgi:hypothetical protein